MHIHPDRDITLSFPNEGRISAPPFITVIETSLAAVRRSRPLLVPPCVEHQAWRHHFARRRTFSRSI
jgi:hypothetical protein